MGTGPLRRHQLRRWSIRSEVVPKSGGGIRVISHLDRAAEAAFALAVARVADRVERALHPTVLGNRLAPGGTLVPWRPARALWSSEIRRRLACPRPPIVLATDVRDCYPSIDRRHVGISLLELGAPPGEVEEILMLAGWFRDQGIPGLPVGPDPSAVLANALLRVTDAALSEIGVRHLRWVDDVVAFLPRVRDVPRALDALHRSLGAIGLSLNENKTRSFDDPHEARAALRGRASLAAGGPHDMMPAP